MSMTTEEMINQLRNADSMFRLLFELRRTEAYDGDAFKHVIQQLVHEGDAQLLGNIALDLHGFIEMTEKVFGGPKSLRDALAVLIRGNMQLDSSCRHKEELRTESLI